MKIIFAGTPEFAAQALAAIADAGHEVALVLSQPDRPSGRGMALTASPVKRLALARGFAVFQPPSLKDAAAQERIRAAAAEVMVVAAYGLILPQAVLDLPRFGCINIHASLLPRWRGAAPIQRALLAGDALQALSFELVAKSLRTVRYTPADMVLELARTAGSLHLVGGQVAESATWGPLFTFSPKQIARQY